MIQDTFSQVVALHTRLRSRKAVNVNDRDTKTEAIQLATVYFERGRPQLAAVIGEIPELLSLDEEWQNLVRLAHGNNQRKTYLSLLSRLSRSLKELSILALVRSPGRTRTGNGRYDLTQSEHQLLSTLESLLPTVAASYRQGILDLQNQDRVSYRGTASEFREALREILDHLAPDSVVTAQPGFKLEEGQRSPTMKQKARFILASRGRSKAQREPTEKAIGVVEALAGEVVRATYTSASLSIHLASSKEDVLRLKRYTDVVLFDLLELQEPSHLR